MTHDEIRAAILASSQLRTWIEEGNDDAVAAALTASASPVPTGELITERSMFASLGPAMAQSVLSTLAAWAASNESDAARVVERGLQWLHPESGGIDLQHPDVRDLLYGLQVANVLTTAQYTALMSLGVRPDRVTHFEVAEAVLPWRPNGKIQPIPE